MYDLNRYSNTPSTRWAGPVCSTTNRVNGNETHLLNKLLEFVLGRLFNHPDVVTLTPPDYVGAIPTSLRLIKISPDNLCSKQSHLKSGILDDHYANRPKLRETLFIDKTILIWPSWPPKDDVLRN